MNKREISKKYAEEILKRGCREEAINEVINKINRLIYTDSGLPVSVEDKLEIINTVTNLLCERNQVLFEQVNINYLNMLNNAKKELLKLQAKERGK